MPTLDQGDELFDRFHDASAVERRVFVSFGVPFELLLVEDLKREVRADEHVYVQVYEGELAYGEARGGVDVAVEVARLPLWLSEEEDCVPAVGPEELRAVRPGFDGAENGVGDLLREEAFEDDQRAFRPYEACGP